MSEFTTARRQRIQNLMLAVFCLLAAATCVGALYPSDLWLQHSPTLPAVLALSWSSRKTQLSTTSFAMFIGFLALHAIGARYIYSYVPYDQWSQHLCGVTISSVFGWERNHYDRLVHFSFGLLLAHPTREILERNELARGIWSRYFALEFIIAASAVYELAEWFLAILFAPDWADRYLGQQGDMWDAQKDMALASCGAIIALAITHRLVIRRAETHSN